MTKAIVFDTETTGSAIMSEQTGIYSKVCGLL